MTLDAVLLAGGRSRRMGRDKALLRHDGRRLVDHLAAELAALGGVLVVATGPDRRVRPHGTARRALVVPDDGGGPMAGVAAALPHLRAESVAVVAVDQPWTSAALLRRAAEAMEFDPGARAAVPVVDGVEQVLHAVYARDLLVELVAAGEASLRRAVRATRVVRLGSEEWGELDPEARFADDWDHPHDR